MRTLRPAQLVTANVPLEWEPPPAPPASGDEPSSGKQGPSRDPSWLARALGAGETQFPGWQTVNELPVLGHTIAANGSVVPCIQKTKKAVWKAFFANAGAASFSKAPLQVKLWLISRSCLAPFAYRCSRWPPRAEQLAMVDRLQTRLVTAAMRMRKCPGDNAESFAQRRNARTARKAWEHGRWSTFWCKRVVDWDGHIRNCDTSDVIPEWDGADLAWEVYARPAKISVSRRRLVSTWLGRKLLISNAFKPILVTSLLVMLFTRFFTPGVSVELATDVPATAICGATMKIYYDLRQPLEFDICRSLVMCWCTFLVMHVVNRDLILSEVTTFESAWMITNCVVSEVALLLNRHSIWDEPHVYNWEWQLGDILRFLSYLPLFVMLCATTDSLRMNKFVKMVCLCIGLSYHLMEYVKARYSTSEWCSGSEFLGMDCREFKNAYQWTMLNITIFMLKALKSYAFGQAFAVVKAAYFKEKTLVAKHMNSGDHWLESFSRGQWLKGTPPQAPRDEE
ncbi:unnamed protein product, partial [Prorocentrum cordatum]